MMPEKGGTMTLATPSRRARSTAWTGPAPPEATRTRRLAILPLLGNIHAGGGGHRLAHDLEHAGRGFEGGKAGGAGDATLDGALRSRLVQPHITTRK